MIELHSVGIRQGSFSLTDVNLRVPKGCYAVLMGPSASGKTTLLEILAGLRNPSSGCVVLNGEDVSTWPPPARSLGYVPQDAAVFKSKTVRENLGFALEVRKSSKAVIRQRVQELAEQLELVSILDRPADSLSGGEAQRVALGRALAFRPSVLLLDEPLNAVDEVTHGHVMRLLQDLASEQTVTVLHVTHNIAETEALADIMFKLEAGTVQVVEAFKSVRPRVV